MLDVLKKLEEEGYEATIGLEVHVQLNTVSKIFSADAYGVARRNYYFQLADARPASRKYAQSRAGGKGGWILRAEAFLSPRFHLTEAGFRERVAAWG